MCIRDRMYPVHDWEKRPIDTIDNIAKTTFAIRFLDLKLSIKNIMKNNEKI